MGGGEINVAYEGTFADLGTAGSGLFTMDDNNDFSQFINGADDFTAVAGAGNYSHAVTVSPQDVFNNDSFPPSTTFTNLTTPGSTYMETPDEDYQTSPLFSDNLGTDSQGADAWFPLFNDDSAVTTPAPSMARTSSSNQIMVHPGGESQSGRKRSSTVALSPAMSTYSPALKHSAVAGVNARKRDKPLPPIVVDPNDTVAVKRARNTAAARKSRDKKVQERDAMQNRIAELEEQVAYWKALATGRQAADEEAG